MKGARLRSTGAHLEGLFASQLLRQDLAVESGVQCCHRRCVGWAITSQLLVDALHQPNRATKAQLTNHDVITIELVEPDGLPPKVKIMWPEHPSLISDKDFPDTAATIAQLFARAHIVLAAIKAHEGPLGPQ